MKKIKRILVPVDYAGGSMEVLESARQLADSLGATIDVLHVWEGSEWRLPAISIQVNGPAGMKRLLAEAAAHDLPIQQAATFLGEAASRGFSVRAHFETGSPADTILRVAEEEGFDMVVMGTHGRTAVGRMVVGSVAQKVVRESLVPVLTLRVDAALPESARSSPAGSKQAGNRG